MAEVEVGAAEVEVAEVEVAEVEVAEVVARQARPWAGVAVSGVVAVVAAGVVLVAGVRVLKVVAAYPLWCAELLQKQCCLTPFVHDLTRSGCTVVLWMCSVLRGSAICHSVNESVSVKTGQLQQDSEEQHVFSALACHCLVFQPTIIAPLK